ncbi:MAG: ABC-type transport system permease component [Caulobacteraceae bacterium]|nr:ABC-type transport system permease component [Caulobacteraceae bacterium]
MNAPKLIFAFIGRKPLTWAFHALTLALGVAVVTALLLLSRSLNDRFDKDLAGVDLVVGAKGSPLQLILSTVFALDTPTGNIPLRTAQTLERFPLFKVVVPVSLGDSVGGYRIVGTQPSYGQLYDARIASGAWWTRPMQVTVGAEAARQLHMHLGQVFAGAHGLATGGELHADTPYTVVGILQPTGTIIDRLVLTDTASVWRVHEQEAVKQEGLTPDEASSHREVTALMIKYRSALGAVMAPRLIQQEPGLQAAVPAIEMARLNSLLGAGTQVLQDFGWGLLALSALGFFVALVSAVSQRRRELALLRALGARPALLFGLIAGEGLMLGLLGGIVGLGLGRAAAAVAAAVSTHSGGPALAVPSFGAADLAILGGAAALSLAASVLPGLLAYRLNASLALQGA